MPHHQKQPPGGRPSAPVDRNVGPGDACGRPKGKERSRCWEVSGPPGYQVGLPAVPLVGLRAAPSQVCHSGKPETMAAKGQAASLGAATHNILLLQNNAINCTFVSGSCHGPAGQDRRSIEWACIRIPQFPILAPIDAYLFFCHNPASSSAACLICHNSKLGYHLLASVRSAPPCQLAETGSSARPYGPPPYRLAPRSATQRLPSLLPSLQCSHPDRRQHHARFRSPLA
jgi:hypothetical protein